MNPFRSSAFMMAVPADSADDFPPDPSARSQPAPSPAPVYWLAPSVYVCATRGGFVFLDLRKNRYFAIPEHRGRALSSLVYDWPNSLTGSPGTEDAVVAREVVAELVNSGLLADRPAPSKPHAIVPVVLDGIMASTTDLCPRPRPIKAHHVFNFARSCLWAACAVRLFPLSLIVATVRRQRNRRWPAHVEFNPAEAAAVADIFRRLRPWVYRADGRCIYHALAVLRFLSYYGLPSFWVIGVSLTPWRAHSWVQYGTLVLDATPNRVTNFTPILVV